LAFEDYSFTERFPQVEDWNNKNWDNKELKYKHQTPGNIQGPTVAVLPSGAGTLRDFVRRNLPLKQLRDERFKMLPFSGRIESRKKMDKTARSYRQYSLELLENRVGIWRVDETLFPWGSSMKAFLEQVDTEHGAYEDFTDLQFQQFVDLLEAGRASGELKLTSYV
jgi:hypothetical protein